jgi:lipopolysaccharide export LptBFGC system permease protein LptF
MKLIQRHLLRDLLMSGGLILVTVLGLFFVMALTFTLGSSKASGVPVGLVLLYAAYLVISSMFLVVPVVVLSATVYAYGRCSASGEFTAARTSGIHPWQMLVPGLLVGSVATLGLVWAQDEIAPSAHLRGRIEISKDILYNLDSILAGGDHQITAGRWKAAWSGRAVDPDGNVVLEDLDIVELDAEGRVLARTTAGRARPVLDKRSQVLTLDMLDVTRVQSDGTLIKSGHLQAPLDLEALARQGDGTRRDANRSYEELLTRAARFSELALTTEDPQERASLEKDGRGTRAVFHFRIAFAFSVVILSFLGASLGLFKRFGNLALVFLVGFLIVIALHYPLTKLGESLATGGVLPVGPALWLGNAAMLLIGLVLYRGVMRG